MSTIRVSSAKHSCHKRTFVFDVSTSQLTRRISSIYQDVALHTEDEFLQMTPPEAKTPEILGDEHLLLLTRLRFELAERKRCVLRCLVPLEPTKPTRMEEMKIQLVKERDALLAQGQHRQSKEEDWDKRTETLAKVSRILFSVCFGFQDSFRSIAPCRTSAVAGVNIRALCIHRNRLGFLPPGMA